MKEKTKQMADAAVYFLREWLPEMDDAERKEVFESVMENYCPHCGGNGVPCFCQNDE